MKTFRCSKCGRTDSVEVMHGGEKTPAEYHCTFCGNYAISGVPTKWEFLEVVKGNSDCDLKVVREEKENKALSSGSSPLQVGESLTVKPDKNVPTSKLPKCKIEGCTNTSWIRGVCADHFHKANGTSYDTYLRNRKDRDEDPKTVAARWTDRRVKRGALVERSKAQDCKQEETMVTEKDCKEHGITLEQYKANKRYKTEPLADVAARVKEAVPQTDEHKLPKSELGPPKPEPARPAVEVKQTEPEPVPLLQVFLDPELLVRLIKKAKEEYRTAEMHAIYLIDKGTRG